MSPHATRQYPVVQFSCLERLAGRAGLSLIGAGDSAALDSGEEHALEAWKASGYAGEMRYMHREPGLPSDPRRIVPEARSLLTFTLHYSKEPPPKRPKGAGRVARYAWGLDYHTIFRRRLGDFIGLVEAEIGRPVAHRSFSDAVPLLERAFAKRSGLGFIGKNTMLIQPRRGSFFFIGEVVSDIEVERERALPVIEESCGACTRCRDQCPTQAFPRDYVLDARRCISYLTIEKRGMLGLWERAALGEWIFGCDICQEVCPFNHTVLKRGERAEARDFDPENGAGPLVDLAELFRIDSNRKFERRYAHSPLLRPGRSGLVRNGLCVAVNTGAEALIPDIERLFAEDRSEVVRATALWALHRFYEQESTSRITDLFSRAQRDEEPLVQAELTSIRGD